jgi:hypothetical protein
MKLSLLSLSDRVGGEPCGSRPPSEPDLKVSLHPAQALRKVTLIGPAARCFHKQTLRYSPAVFSPKAGGAPANLAIAVHCFPS